EAGDQIEMRLLDPQGRVIADSRAPALPSYKDQYDIGLAHARPPAGWGRGAYVAEARLWRGGKLIQAKRFSASI
ncbi:MAG TPA: hypothetical protein VHV27_01065, partial [Phenylobacterium sp.]|nr:hypothetical protein [Phenylobacterium sp.]